jgi:DNA-binding transcriptional ArsR family regulator
MQQLGLSFDIRDPAPQWDLPPEPARARATDPEPSHAAAAKVDAKGLAALVLAELARAPGTTHELADRLGISLVTVSPRMKPLEGAGLVTRAGKRDGRTVWKRKPPA